VECPEPALRLFNHGLVSDASGQVMSKSKGNVVSPMEIVAQHGADVARLAMFFAAPSEKEVQWNNDAVVGVEKFAVNRLYPLVTRYRGSNPDLKQYFKGRSLGRPFCFL
jgi:leucyl-tRNA synthetase